MRILLTGHSGFLGGTLKKIFDEDSHQVYPLVKSGMTINITRAFSLNNNYDTVVHCAGKAHSVPKTSLEKQAFFDVNFTGTQNLLQGLEESQSLPTAFIFISTVAVYGRDNGVNISENAPLLAKDPYGLSKIKAEKIILDWCKKHNVICTILRLPLLVGQNPPGNLGAMIKGIQKGYYFNIAGGNAKKSMVLAEDVAKSILKVAEIGGIYNLTDGYHPSFAELSNHISYQLGKGRPVNLPLWFVNIIAKLGDLLGDNSPINSNKFKKIVSDLTFDDSRAREAFGWNPTPVLGRVKFN